jgi:hypothetical protein
MPAFEQVINFGGGGGGGRNPLGYCHNYELSNPLPNPAIFGTSATISSDFTERMGELCFKGIKPNLPFSVRIVSPDGLITLSGNFYADANKLYLAGSPNAIGEITSLEKRAPLGSVGIYWPVGLPFGQWQIYAQGEGLQAQGFFEAPIEDGEFGINRFQEIGVVELNAQFNILPGDSPHNVKTSGNGDLSISGAGFIPKELIYIILYESTITGNEKAWKLMYKTQTNADDNGLLATSIPGPFWGGEEYLLISVSGSSSLVESNTNSLNRSDRNIGYENFYVIPQVSCPGAPAQRMVVGNNGNVCTKSDAVLVRDAPMRSANTLLELDPGASFRVVGGPSCADNWSWWKIQIDGKPIIEGWVSEGGDQTDPYFICPLK